MIRTDENLNTKWIISIDINNSSDLMVSQQSDLDVVYSITVNSEFITWIFLLNFTTGDFMKSKCYQQFLYGMNEIYSSDLKYIYVLKTLSDKLIIMLPITNLNSRLMFCKYFSIIYIVNKTTLELIKVYYYVHNFPPTWYGYSEKLDADIMFFSNYNVVSRLLMDKQSQNIIESRGVYRDFKNYQIFLINEIMIVNPSNSSDWSSDPSCFIKYISRTNTIYGDNLASSIQLDKYNFDLGGTYCDQPIELGSDMSNNLGEAFKDENDSTGKYNTHITHDMMYYYFCLLYHPLKIL